MFVDQSRKPDQGLREFEILGESPGVDGCRRFQVKLVLEEPDESILASYYVFGQGPIWVYRAEDFEMMMHMDPMVKAEAPAAGEEAKPERKLERRTRASSASGTERSVEREKACQVIAVCGNSLDEP